MANLPESATYDAGVYQLETTDAVVGGAAGKSNASAINLANRTAYLKAHVDSMESVVPQAEAEAGTATTLRGWTAQRVMQAAKGASRTKVITVTRDISVTGAQVITGVGFQPRSLMAVASVTGTSQISIGFSDFTNEGCIRDDNGTSAGTYKPTANFLVIGLNSTNNAGPVASAPSADGFTLTWSKAGTPTGTATLYIMARE